MKKSIIIAVQFIGMLLLAFVIYHQSWTISNYEKACADWEKAFNVMEQAKNDYKTAYETTYYVFSEPVVTKP